MIVHYINVHLLLLLLLFRVLVMTRAAEFITLCNLSVMTLGNSASTALQ